MTTDLRKNMTAVSQAAFSMYFTRIQNMNNMFVHGLSSILCHFAKKC